MKIKLVRTDSKPHGYTTVGWWGWTELMNRGTLVVEVSKLPDWRYSLAVIGHEFIEAAWCKLFRIYTEECDAFDDWMETQYASGNVRSDFEGGFHEHCPYRTGHVLGSWWERFVITVTFASWKSYDRACNDVMGLP